MFIHVCIHRERWIETMCSPKLAKYVQIHVNSQVSLISFPSRAKKTHTPTILPSEERTSPTPPHVNVDPKMLAGLTEVCVFFAPRNRPPGLNINTEHWGKGVPTRPLHRQPMCVFFARDGTPRDDIRYGLRHTTPCDTMFAEQCANPSQTFKPPR